MKCFLKCLVSAMECLCRCLTSQQNSLHYTALIKVRVECPPHWNRTKRTKRTKRTLTGIGRRLRVHPNELLFNALGIGNGMPMHMCHFTKPISYYTALIKVKGRVECPPLWNRTKRTKRTKRTLTGLKNRGTVTSTVPRYGHLRSNGFDWLKVFLQKNRKKGTLMTSWYTLCGSA